MSRVGWLLLGILFLQGCSFSQPPAPVRDINHARRAIHRPSVQPPPGRVVVQPGDNLFRIAFDHGLDYRELAGWNGLDDPSRIQVGQVLRLTPPPSPVQPSPPSVATPAPQAGTPGPAAKPAGGSTVQPVKQAVDAMDEAPADWVWPAAGSLVTRFDLVAGDKGIDIAGRRGSPVVAAAGGRVVYVGAGLRGYGKLIIIKHSRILLSAYGHNEQVLVSEGQNVKQGQPIAKMGDTDAQRVELHFEIREYGKPVDPMTYLPANQAKEQENAGRRLRGTG